MKKVNRREFLEISSLSALSLPFIQAPMYDLDPEKKLRFALVGLGRYAGYLARGIEVSAHCKLTSIVTGDSFQSNRMG